MRKSRTAFASGSSRGSGRRTTGLPPEPDLAKQLGVSRGTLRRALETLIGEGASRQVVGRGTFVISTVIEPAIAQKLSTLSEHRAAQEDPDHDLVVLDLDVVEAPSR